MKRYVLGPSLERSKGPVSIADQWADLIDVREAPTLEKPNREAVEFTVRPATAIPLVHPIAAIHCYFAPSPYQGERTPEAFLNSSFPFGSTALGSPADQATQAIVYVDDVPPGSHLMQSILEYHA